MRAGRSGTCPSGWSTPARRRCTGRSPRTCSTTTAGCWSPGPGEGDESAIARRARDELGLDVAGLRPAVPGYRYRAEFRGVVENEICPVYLGRFTGPPVPDPTEVGDWELLDWASFRRRQETEGDAWSPWCREQARLIEQAGLA